MDEPVRRGVGKSKKKSPTPQLSVSPAHPVPEEAKRASEEPSYSPDDPEPSVLAMATRRGTRLLARRVARS